MEWMKVHQQKCSPDAPYTASHASELPYTAVTRLVIPCLLVTRIMANIWGIGKKFDTIYDSNKPFFML